MNACGSVVNLSINGQQLIASCLWLVRTWLADFHTLRGVLCIAHVQKASSVDKNAPEGFMAQSDKA